MEMNMLIEAIKKDDLSELKQAIRSIPGFDMNMKFPGFLDTLLVTAASHLNAERIVRFLIAREANLDSEDESGKTPLKLATDEGHFNIVKLLVENGADINKKAGEFGWTALVNACARNHCRIAEFLIKKGADINVTFENGPLLLFVLNKGYFDIASLLIKSGANVNDKTKYGFSILQQAVFEDQLTQARFLLDNGANPDLKADNGGTPLGAALFKKNHEMVELLKRYGAKDDGTKGARDIDPPNKNELKLLPIWARIAFSLRCARYVQNLVKEFWPNADAKYFQAIETLLITIENAVKFGKKPECASFFPLLGIVQEAMKLAEQLFQNEFKKKAIKYSIWSAAATFFALIAIDENQSQITDFVFASVERSTLAVLNSIPLLANNIEEVRKIPAHFLGSKEKPLMGTIWKDYYKILIAATENNWTDKTPVPPNFFEN